MVDTRLPTNPKKLTGEQRQKLRKMPWNNKNKLSTQGSTEDQSNTPSASAEAARRIRSPEEQNNLKNKTTRIRSGCYVSTWALVEGG